MNEGCACCRRRARQRPDSQGIDGKRVDGRFLCSIDVVVAGAVHDDRRLDLADETQDTLMVSQIEPLPGERDHLMAAMAAGELARDRAAKLPRRACDQDLHSAAYQNTTFRRIKPRAHQSVFGPQSCLNTSGTHVASRSANGRLKARNGGFCNPRVVRRW